MTMMARIFAVFLAISAVCFSLPARADIWSDLAKTAPLSTEIGSTDSGDASGLAGE